MPIRGFRQESAGIGPGAGHGFELAGRGAWCEGVEHRVRFGRNVENTRIAPDVPRGEDWQVAWRPPAGVRVEQIRWSSGTRDQLVPVLLTGTDEVVVVSPFVDKNFLARQKPKGEKPGRRVLLTTMREIERIGPSLAAFDDLLALDAPDYPIGDPEPDSQSAVSAEDMGPTDDEEEEIVRGLHAKAAVHAIRAVPRRSRRRSCGCVRQ